MAGLLLITRVYNARIYLFAGARTFLIFAGAHTYMSFRRRGGVYVFSQARVRLIRRYTRF